MNGTARKQSLAFLRRRRRRRQTSTDTWRPFDWKQIAELKTDYVRRRAAGEGRMSESDHVPDCSRIGNEGVKPAETIQRVSDACVHECTHEAVVQC